MRPSGMCGAGTTTAVLPVKLGKCGRRIVRRNEMQRVAFPAEDSAKLGFANPCGILQHGLEYRLQIAGRALI